MAMHFDAPYTLVFYSMAIILVKWRVLYCCHSMG